ncbi:serine/threonine protein kinase [Haloglycomyces albus]|uniref:serine/threonine protein kinase n=1 Tax=Haloglycomyces albus TaxID=526067 RepID=UPI00046D0687|nr:protein kinase [Haloglycomyces albus]
MTIQPSSTHQSSHLNLVCGPVDPMNGSEQSYRLTRLLGSGGQADVYQAVRLSAGISSTPVTVKIFRLQPDIDPQQQYRSWDKGDAVLMDLHSRGAESICRRIDAFYGRLPHFPHEDPSGDQVPYQVLEYLPGYDLRQYLGDRLGRLDGVHTLRTIAQVLQQLHNPQGGTHPILHMDIKPANVIIGPEGNAKIIDFTGARYHSPNHITTISYTRETAGPEAYEGRVGPSYDVHGFGSVAFYLITGATARTDSQDNLFPGQFHSDPWARLRQHPYLESNPRLRDHLYFPLADTPADRPTTAQLPRWIDELIAHVHRSPLPDLGVDWGPPPAPAQPSTGRARPTVAAPVPGPDATAVMEPGDFDRMVGGRQPVNAASTFNAPPMETAGTSQPAPRNVGRVQATDNAEANPTPPTDEPAPQQRSPHTPQDDRDMHPLLGPPGSMRRGLEFSFIGSLFTAIMWLLWILQGDRSVESGAMFLGLTITVAVSVFFLLRLTGGVFWGRMMGAKRRSARLSHLMTGGFMVAVGIGYLLQIDWELDSLIPF